MDKFYDYVDGKMTFCYDKWLSWRADLPPAGDHYRLDIELSYPRDTLPEVPVFNSDPHKGMKWNNEWMPPWFCFYRCDDWSTVHGIHYVSNSIHEELTYRMMVESGHGVPLWGDRIEFLCTSSALINEPWGQNPSNTYANFKDKFWLVTWKEPMFEWNPPIGWPITDGLHGIPKTNHLGELVDGWAIPQEMLGPLYYHAAGIKNRAAYKKNHDPEHRKGVEAIWNRYPWVRNNKG